MTDSQPRIERPRSSRARFRRFLDDYRAHRANAHEFIVWLPEGYDTFDMVPWQMATAGHEGEQLLS